MIFYTILIVFWLYSGVHSLPRTLEEGNNVSLDVQSGSLDITVTNVNATLKTDEMSNISKIRVKRQGGGASKFTDASKMPQIKQLRLFLQLFKNFWDSSYVGGSHPLHPNVPKTVVALYKTKIVEFFVPDVGEQKEFST